MFIWIQISIEFHLPHHEIPQPLLCLYELQSTLSQSIFNLDYLGKSIQEQDSIRVLFFKQVFFSLFKQKFSDMLQFYEVSILF